MLRLATVRSVELIEGVGKETKKPYKMIKLVTMAGAEASFFIGEWTKKEHIDLILSWKEGQEVEVFLTKKGNYLNFRLPTDKDKMHVEIESLKKRVTDLEAIIQKPTEVVTQNNFYAKDVTLEELAENGVIEDTETIPF